MAGGFAKLFVGGVVTFNMFHYVYRYTARKLTGWEDDTTEEFHQRKIANFEKANPEEKVIKLEIRENYF